MAVDPNILYIILSRIALQPTILTYTNLSDAYYKETGEWHEPHGSWDAPLGELNRDLDLLGWPPLSAVVVLNDSREPGGLFWESSPAVPPRPRNDLDRTIKYAEILSQVHNAPWTSKYPTKPPV